MLMQVRDPIVINGALLGLGAAIAFALGWARFGHLINVKRFFQVTGFFFSLHGSGRVSIPSTNSLKQACCPTAKLFTKQPRSFHLMDSTANGFLCDGGDLWIVAVGWRG